MRIKPIVKAGLGIGAAAYLLLDYLVAHYNFKKEERWVRENPEQMSSSPLVKHNIQTEILESRVIGPISYSARRSLDMELRKYKS